MSNFIQAKRPPPCDMESRVQKDTEKPRQSDGKDTFLSFLSPHLCPEVDVAEFETTILSDSLKLSIASLICT